MERHDYEPGESGVPMETDPTCRICGNPKGFYLHRPYPADACYSHGGDCAGDVHEYVSRSGATTALRCEYHQRKHDERMDEVERGLNERYPGWNTPGSPPPSDFDPLYAGERWDEDY